MTMQSYIKATFNYFVQNVETVSPSVEVSNESLQLLGFRMFDLLNISWYYEARVGTS